MCDGSLDKAKRSMILHNQDFTQQENQILSSELNTKFGLHTQVIKHKLKYYVIKIPVDDAQILRTLMQPYILPSMIHKLPSSDLHETA